MVPCVEDISVTAPLVLCGRFDRASERSSLLRFSWIGDNTGLRTESLRLEPLLEFRLSVCSELLLTRSEAFKPALAALPLLPLGVSDLLFVAGEDTLNNVHASGAVFFGALPVTRGAFLGVEVAAGAFLKPEILLLIFVGLSSGESSRQMTSASEEGGL